MATDNNFKHLVNGLNLVPNPTTEIAAPGDIDYSTDTGKFNFYGAGGSSPGVTENGVQTLTNKTLSVTLNNITGTVGTAAQFDPSTGNLESSVTTSTELGYVHGVTSNIQTQINGLQPSGNYITALTGDITASGPGSAVATLATVNSNVGSFGSSTSIPSFTVNGKGLITAASGNVVIAPAGTLSGTTLNSTVVNSSLTSVGTITSGTWNGTAIAIANGGTGQTTASAAYGALSPMTTTGDLEYESAPGIASRLPIGSNNQVLQVSSGLPSWQTFTALTNPMTTTGDLIYSSDNFGTPTRLPIGTTGQVLEVAGGIPTWTTVSSDVGQVAIFNETQPSGTNGGSFPSGTYYTRVLNTTVLGQSWATIFSNQIILQTGTYYIDASAPAYSVTNHKAKLYNVSTTSDAIIGTAEQNPGGAQTRSFIEGVLVVPFGTTFEIQHRCSSSEGSLGFGSAAAYGDNEVYTTISITKLA